MVNNNVANVVVGKPLVSGGVLIAPLLTPLPTNESTTPNASFLNAGYITDDGVARQEKRDSGNIYAWGGTLIAITQKASTVTAKFGFAEYLNPIVQKALYGAAAVTTTAATVSAGNKLAVAASAAQAPAQEWIIELVSGLARGRLVFPNARITDTDDVEYKDDDIASRGVTLTLAADSAGNYFYEYWDDGQHI